MEYAARERRPMASGGRRAAGKFGPIMYNGRSVPHYFQGDDRWGSILLNDNDTLASAGCAVTSIASVCSFFGRKVTPDLVDSNMDRNGGYSQGSDGIADWDVALATAEGPSVTIKLERSMRLYEGDSADEMYDLIERSLRQNVPVIGRVKYGNSKEDYDHFLVIAGKSAAGKHLLVDPGLPNGDGPADPKQPDVVLEKCTRNGGLQLVGAQLLRVTFN